MTLGCPGTGPRTARTMLANDRGPSNRPPRYTARTTLGVGTQITRHSDGEGTLLLGVNLRAGLRQMPDSPLREIMASVPLINLSVQHHQTQEQARRRLETAVRELSASLGVMLRRVEWATDRNRVRLEGVGFWVELWIDAQALHASGDAPIIGRLLGGPLGVRLKQIVERTFQKQLP